MKKFQFFLKDSVVIHANIEIESYKDEKSQLLEQGFKLSGDLIEAEDVEAAYKKHHSAYHVENAQYPLLGRLVDLPQALALRAILGG